MFVNYVSLMFTQPRKNILKKNIKKPGRYEHSENINVNVSKTFLEHIFVSSVLCMMLIIFV